MIQLHGGGFHVGRGDVRGDHAVAVQVLTGQGFQHGLGLGVELGKAADGQHGVQGTEQVDGTLDDEDDANGHDQRLHGAEGVQDHHHAQHHAEHRQQQEALPAGILTAAQVQSVLDAAQAVEDDEQAEHDGQDAHHDVAAEDEERAQAQADDARDEGELALEDAALHGKVAHQLNGGAHQHHAAQGVADHVEGGGGPHEQEDAQPQVEHAHQDQIPFQLLCHKRSRSFLVPDRF